MTAEKRLDNRLALCADFVRPDSKLADIGTDHAYLPVWLCRRGVCPSAIAADVNPDPLARGRLTIENAGLSGKIETRLSDGLSMIDGGEADDIVIAGMGGELIARIIGAWEYSRDGEKRFILQPMTRSESLILWLCQNGFEIEKQDCCAAGGKSYTVLAVKYTGECFEPDEVFCYAGRLTPREKPEHRRFIEKHIDRLKKQARSDAHCSALAERLEELCG